MPTNCVAEKVVGSPRYETYAPTSCEQRRTQIIRHTHFDAGGTIYIDQVHMSELLFDLLYLNIVHCPTEETLQ